MKSKNLVFIIQCIPAKTDSLTYLVLRSSNRFRLICETKTLLDVNRAVWSLTSSTVLCIGPSLSPNFCKQTRPAFLIVPHITYNPSIYFNTNTIVIINCNKKCFSGVVNSYCQSRNSHFYGKLQ